MHHFPDMKTGLFTLVSLQPGFESDPGRDGCLVVFHVALGAGSYILNRKPGDYMGSRNGSVVKHWTRDQKVPGSSFRMSSWRLFISRVNFLF